LRATDAQVRMLMEEMRKHGKVGLAGARAGMHRNTASKYLGLGKLPSELKQPRDWQTRADPFEEDWPELKARLKDAPELEARALFEDLQSRKPDTYHAGQLRTLQRRIKQWRALEGPPKEVFFAQEHRPGEAAQTDFTSANELAIVIAGEPFPHLLCQVVLPYSNWQWATACRSESMLALQRGVQSAVFRLGRVPTYHQTDNSTAATHDLRTGKRGFNEDYSALMRHLVMEPRTVKIGAKEQNGDVESLNGVLKRRLEQHLLLRGSREFTSVEQYEAWLQEKLEAANRLRQKRVEQELAVMKPLQVRRLPEYTETEVTVTSWSTIRVKNSTYSVPSRLRGESVRVRVYDERLEVYYGGVHQLSVERLLGRNGHRINYRHIIWSLVQKPGAFERYRYRDDLFPSLTFRRTYDALCEGTERRKADMSYLRILHLAASTMESEVESALELLLDAGVRPGYRATKDLVAPDQPTVPEVVAGEVDLREYDTLLEQSEAVAS